MRSACLSVLLVAPTIAAKHKSIAKKSEQTLIELPEAQNLQTGGIESISESEKIVTVTAFTEIPVYGGKEYRREVLVNEVKTQPKLTEIAQFGAEIIRFIRRLLGIEKQEDFLVIDDAVLESIIETAVNDLTITGEPG